MMYECIRSAHTPLILQAQTAGNGIASSICSAQHVTLTTALGRTCQRRYETIRKAEIVDARTAVANLECTIEGIFRCTPGSQHLRIKGVLERQRSRSAKVRRERTSLSESFWLQDGGKMDAKSAWEVRFSL